MSFLIALLKILRNLVESKPFKMYSEYIFFQIRVGLRNTTDWSKKLTMWAYQYVNPKIEPAEFLRGFFTISL